MKKGLLALLLAAVLLCTLALTALGATTDTGFADVAVDAWYADAVAYVRDNNLMSGTSATAFEPSATTSRAMLVTILYRQAGSPAALAADFPDVEAGVWYANAAGWAAANGIVGGYSDGRFAPSDPVTREQLAAILWRTAGTPAPGSAEPFADQSAIAPYAASAVAWARESGIIGGKSGNRFDPDGLATRAETAVILHRYLGGGATTPESPDAPSGTTRILVAYFSRTGNTQGVAETIATATGGDLFEIVPETAYPTDYNTCLSQAQRELSADTRPALSSHVEDIAQYDVVLLGFPIWHGNTPMPIRTFLEEYDLSGKTIAPFATSGSGGIGSAVSAIRTLCPGTKVANGLSITSATLGQAGTLATEWLGSLDLPEGSGRNPESTPAPTPIPTPTPEPTPGEEEDAVMPKLTIQAGGQTFTATLVGNATTRALLERLPLTVTMGELNGNEKYYNLPNSLPTNAQNPGRIQTGDLMLFGSDCVVLFYESFSTSYSYTRLGSLDNPAGLASTLGSGSVEVTFRID